MNKKIDTFDLTYANRYVERNYKKIHAIIQNTERCESVIDIGCNQGYVVKAFLNNGLATQGFGVDLNREVVDRDLLSNSNFIFCEQDIIDFKFLQAYDVVIYNSVHHHIFGKYGKNASFKLWQDIVDHCDRTLIFETGLLAEEGLYYWKTEIEKYYSIDEHHLSSLFRAIGSRLKKIEEITQLPIHGTYRTIYKISLYPIKSEYNLKSSESTFYGTMYTTEDNWRIIERCQRTVGSKKQKLVAAEKENRAYHLFDETEFYILKKKSKEEIFAKKIKHNPYKQMREFKILESVRHPNVINLLGVHPDLGLLFPYKPWPRLSEVDFRQITNVNEFRQSLLSFFEYAKDTFIDLGFLDFTPEKAKPRQLTEIIDLHMNNFLLNIIDNMIIEWVVVDLEYCSNTYTQRNSNNLNAILKKIEPSNFSKESWLNHLFKRVNI